MTSSRAPATTPASRVLDVIAVCVVSLYAALGPVFAVGSLLDDHSPALLVPIAVLLAGVTVLAWRRRSIRLVMLALALAAAGQWVLLDGDTHGALHGTVPVLLVLGLLLGREVTDRFGLNPAGVPRRT